MKRFFLIPALALLLALIGCTCTASGNVSTPTKAPTSVPTAAPTAQPTASPEITVAPVMPTEPMASPSAGATASNP